MIGARRERTGADSKVPAAPGVSGRARTADEAARPAAFVLGLFETGLAAVRSLARAGVHVVGVDDDASEPGFASRYCEKLLVGDPTAGEPDIADRLIEHSRGFQGRPVLLPASDAWVLYVSRNRDRLADHFLFSVGPCEVVEASVDKRLMYELAAEAGVPTADTYYPASLQEARALAEGVRYPALVKPYVGHLWRRHFPEANKGFKVRGPAELIEAIARAMAVEQPVMVQSVVSGPTTNLYHYVTCVGDSGELLGEFVQRKIHQYRPEFGVGALAESVVDEDVSEIGRRFVTSARFRGICAVEFKRDEADGTLRLIEINPRLWLQVALAMDCGVDFPLIAYRELAGEEQHIPRTYTLGRKWLDPALDIPSFFESRRDQHVSAISWAGTWRHVRSFPCFAWDDPGPFISKWSRLAGKVPGRLARGRSSRVGTDDPGIPSRGDDAEHTQPNASGR